MLIGMNRFLTREQIEQLYQIPGVLLPGVMANVPVVSQGDDGQDYFVESDVDRAVDAVAASVTGRTPLGSAAPKGKPGRKNSTADIAEVVNNLKEQGKTWKEILAACKHQFPGRAKNVEQVRAIWRRHFQGKK